MIPEIKLETFHSIIGSGVTPEWLTGYCEKLAREQPTFFNYLATIKQTQGEHAAMVGIMVFRMIESQLEAKELNELFDKDSFGKSLFDEDFFDKDLFNDEDFEHPTG